jgi:membrane fusion protein (multidrug efflux system)
MSMLKLLIAVSMSGAVYAQGVEVVKVVSRSAERKIQLPGEFIPFQTVTIHAKVTGFVDRVEVDRGSVVKKGQLLATLDAPELRAQRAEAEAKVLHAESQRAEAEAKLAGAQSTYEKLKAASATPGVIAGNELVQAEKIVDAVRAQGRAVEGSIKAAQASVQVVRDMENYLKVTAPFDGVITERMAHPGALVGPGGGTRTAMFQLEQTTRLRLVVAVPETDVGGIVNGSRVSFTVPAYPGQTFTGIVSRTSHTVDPKTRAMAVEMDVMNPRGALASGMYPSVMWPVRQSRPSLLLPATSIVTTTEKTFVIRVKNGAAEWVPVTRGPVVGDLVEVYGPLQANDVVLKRGSDEVRQGTKLNVKSPG